MNRYLIQVTVSVSVEVEAKSLTEATKLAVLDVEDVFNQHDWDWDEVIGENGVLLGIALVE